MELLHHFLERSARDFPDKPALIDAHGRGHAYREIDEAANRFAHGLQALGVAPQERVAVYLENGPEAVVAIFGALKAGAVFVVVNPQVKRDRLAYILRDCNVRVLVTSGRLAAAARPGVAECPDLRAVLLAEPSGEAAGDAAGGPVVGARVAVHSFRAFLEAASGTPLAPRVIDIDLASLIYTSGSTGNPKGVMLTHRNMTTAAASITAYLENTPEDVILSCLPLSFDYGLYQVLMAFRFGGTVILERPFVYPYPVLERMRREGVTGFPIVPAMAAILLQLKDLAARELPRLRYITSTAQAFPPEHIQRLGALFPGTRIYSMYGLTECKRVAYLPPEELARRPGSVGKAIPNSEVFIVDEAGRRIVSAWTPGELMVRGSHVMKGYWNLPQETAARLREGIVPYERVLATGDLFQMDEEGFLYFISRKDDLIKTGGELVSPKEVEGVLYALPDVLEAAAVPRPDPILGWAVKAVVQLAAGSRLGEKEIRRHCAERLENYKVPKEVEIRRSPLPKTTTGKIAKRDLAGAPPGADTHPNSGGHRR